MTITTQIIVRPYELDSYNHVNNSVYQNYLEYARMDYLNKVGFRYKDFFEAGYFSVVTHVDIHYKAPALLNDKLIVETKSIKLKTIQGSFSQTIKKEDGTVCIQATVDWACINKDGRPCKIPEEFIVEALKPEEVQ
ncbi:MAG: acyl-CoA thioesterase [Treponemataceae bacterium]